MSKYEDIRNEIRQTMIAVYGDPDAKEERKNENRCFVPFLTPEKYHDPTHTIQDYHDVYQRCVARRRKEVERLKLENAERARFDADREEYRRWLDRKLNWEKTHKGMTFREICPKVSDRVKESFSKDGKDLRVPFFKKLPTIAKEENGQSDAIAKRPEPTGYRRPAIPDLLPPPPPLPHSSGSQEASSSMATQPVIDEAKKRDLELFGDDEEFEKSQPLISNPGPSGNKISAPSIEKHHSHKRSRSRSKSRSPSAKKHKKDKKEKKAKKERKERERKEKEEMERHEKERRHEHEERSRHTADSHHSEDRERSREHKHKKHKHKEHHRNE